MQALKEIDQEDLEKFPDIFTEKDLGKTALWELDCEQEEDCDWGCQGDVTNCIRWSYQNVIAFYRAKVLNIIE